MPTKREREYYAKGFQDGARWFEENLPQPRSPIQTRYKTELETKRKRKLSAWQKFVKANAKKPRFRLRSGSPNLKKMAVAYRKKKR